MKNKTSKIIITLISVLLIIVGIIVFLFPFISNYFYENKVAQNEKLFLSQKTNTKLDDLYNELNKRNIEMYENGQKGLDDPFSYATSDIDLTKYGINDNTVGYLEVPKLSVKLPILLGANYDNLLKGACHMTNTSYPIGGDNTNSVIAAHRGWNTAQMFRHIEKLEVGDRVVVKNFRETLTYEVSEIEIIYPNEVDKLVIRDNQDMLTLITCHPYRVNNRRYVVYCTRVNI